MVSVFGVKAEELFQRHTKFPPVILDFQPRGIFLLDNHVILYGSEVTAHTHIHRTHAYSRTQSSNNLTK